MNLSISTTRWESKNYHTPINCVLWIMERQWNGIFHIQSSSIQGVANSPALQAFWLAIWPCPDCILPPATVCGVKLAANRDIFWVTSNGSAKEGHLEILHNLHLCPWILEVLIFAWRAFIFITQSTSFIGFVIDPIFPFLLLPFIHLRLDIFSTIIGSLTTIRLASCFVLRPCPPFLSVGGLGLWS